MQHQHICIRGARTHNLKNISLDIARQQLVVVTGLSGSGKSSLAFDTLYAEGQRRYVESLSTYARQFLQLMEKPDVDLIEGLSPAIAIEQKSISHNPRSTVATTTDIHDYLRLLFARTGTPYCPTHHVPLKLLSVSQIVAEIYTLPVDTKIALLAPLPLEKNTWKGCQQLCQTLASQGYVRVRINGHIMDINDVLQTAVSPDLSHDPHFHIEVVIDRLKVRPDNRARLIDSIEMALSVGQDRVLLLNLETQTVHKFTTQYACPQCDYMSPILEPKHFSFNSPVGACPTCDGLGHIRCFDPQKVIISEELSLTSGAIYGWDYRNLHTGTMIRSLAQHYHFDPQSRLVDLSPTIRTLLLYGSQGECIDFQVIQRDGSKHLERKPFEGVLPLLEERFQRTSSQALKEDMEQYRHEAPCPECHGQRLRLESRHVYIGENDPKTLSEIESLSLQACEQWFATASFASVHQTVAQRLTHEIQTRLHFLNNVGLSYLSLDRHANTISGGEGQRIRLASQIGSSLSGVMYVLDEPSIGLHQRDNERMIDTLFYLRDLGNSVIVVEHDEDMIRRADQIIDMGPQAGEHGGQVVAQGTVQDIMDCPQSITGQWLRGQRTMPHHHPRVVDDNQAWLSLLGCTGHNLKNVDLHLPIGKLIGISGVSGSGKSTLINETLAVAAAQHLHRSKQIAQPYRDIQGLEQFDKVITVDQSPIGRTPRSNPATYTGLFTPIRELFASTPEAKARGYTAGRFSFNVKEGRCNACQGDGLIKVEMHFMPDMYVVCESCKGQRYNAETLEIRYRQKTIAEVLEMTVEQAHQFFAAIPTVARKLHTLMEVGLSYIRLGQSATTLSGGEAQRIKLAHELSRLDTGHTLYILDEPTTGLHFEDIAMLSDLLQRLVDKKNTVVIIEHNLDVLAQTDWLIDMGYDGGAAGGQIVAQGTPYAVSQDPKSVTGKYLQAKFPL